MDRYWVCRCAICGSLCDPRDCAGLTSVCDQCWAALPWQVRVAIWQGRQLNVRKLAALVFRAEERRVAKQKQ